MPMTSLLTQLLLNDPPTLVFCTCQAIDVDPYNCPMHGEALRRNASVVEVLVVETGDRAECEDEASALLAARTIGEEARVSIGIWRNDPTLKFLVGRTVVRTYKLSDLKGV